MKIVHNFENVLRKKTQNKSNIVTRNRPSSENGRSELFKLYVYKKKGF